MTGRSSWVITRSDHMQVIHSGTRNLNILEILGHFWPTSESCRQATNKDMDVIFPVRALPSLTYHACNYDGIDMHSLATVLCIVGENFVQIWKFTGQNVLFWRGSIKRADLQTAYRYRIESCRVDFHMIGWSAWVNTRSDHMQVSHSGTSKLNILEI